MKKPTWPEVCALAEKHDDLIYSIKELQRFTRDCAFPPDLIALFWPKATPRRLAMVQEHIAAKTIKSLSFAWDASSQTEKNIVFVKIASEGRYSRFSGLVGETHHDD